MNAYTYSPVMPHLTAIAYADRVIGIAMRRIEGDWQGYMDGVPCGPPSRSASDAIGYVVADHQRELNPPPPRPTTERVLSLRAFSTI